jgi:putative urate catabolism protein
MVGYGPNPPDPQWPEGARIAVSFVLNVEEGGENSVLHGDPTSETFLSEMINAQPFADRHLSMESLYEYGSRAGVWRVLGLFAARGLPLTVFAVARALQANPALSRVLVDAGHEIAGHGLRWISYQEIDIDVERAHLAEAVRIMTGITGAAPLGWYTGRDSPNTRALVVDHGGFLYDSDSYADDLPTWVTVAGRMHLVIPYTMDTNDMRFATAQGFNSGDQFFAYCRDAFDVLYSEGATAPKMLTIGLHARIIGRPARFAALQRLVDHILARDRVWVARRVDIARHWIERFPPPMIKGDT